MAVQQNCMALSPRQTLNGQRVLRIPGSAIKIATWNVRSMYTQEKIKNVEQEMTRLNIDILGISEARWKGSGIEESEEYVTYYSGNTHKDHRQGVAVMVKRHHKASIINFLPISDRVMLLQIRSQPVNINIVQVYAQTADKSDDTVETFYNEIKDVLQKLKTHECNIVMGDFNAKIGEGSVADIVGGYGLGLRNDRGDRLIQFCQEESLVVTNTFYKLPPRRLYTWKSPADSPSQIVRNQIDFILVNKRYRNSFKAVKTYPGADVGSDHNPLVGTVTTKLKRLISPKMRPKFDISRLRDVDIKQRFHMNLHNQMHELQQSQRGVKEPEQVWNQFKDVIINTAKEILTPTAVVKKKEWITDEIMDLMIQRREVKHTDPAKYRLIHRLIGRKCIEAKENWINDRCTEVESLQARHDSFNMYKKINEILGLKKKPANNTLIDKNGAYAMTIKEKLDIWKEYIEGLFYDNRSENEQSVVDHTGPSITKDEISYAIKSAKNVTTAQYP
ncbi:craniofacial development protein 2-like [Plutella xylostella]|uniref:craniofacial development protein 2-like n=1 Tax=Plutella xylostella TaxID=51655 RepID=UPI002032460E|nr:craniofacial development protein 2-like [Plutella xylostella]